MAALTLYGRGTSSCSARLRIALALKGVPYTPVYVARAEQKTTEFAALSPSQTVPILAVAQEGGTRPLLITQSVAALEYVEEVFPDTPALLPPEPSARARVRALVELMAGDTQPRQAVQTLNLLGCSLAGLASQDNTDVVTAAKKQWAHDVCIDGFAAYEQLADKPSDVSSITTAATAAAATPTFSVGTSPTLADCCLVPMVWNAIERWGVDLQRFPSVARIYANMMALPAVANAHWQKQPDTSRP